MDIENEIFKRTSIDFDKLKSYGFIKNQNNYRYSKEFMNDNFRADITVDAYGNVSGKVYDTQVNEEYTNIRIKNSVGKFVNSVKNEYIEILKDIRNNCFEKQYFISSQANRIAKYIINKYGDEPEFLWNKMTGSGVFRNKNNEKWYGIIMNIDKSKIDDGQGEIEIIDIKLDEVMIKYLINKKGFYEGYHMNKNKWLTIILDNSISDEDIFKLIDKSYNLVDKKEHWLIPANLKYYDVINCFNDTDIIEWKQSNDIHVGDIIYIYITNPYSSIFYKCEAIEVNIPFDYSDNNLSMKKIMKIKLLKRYKQDEINFLKLNNLGIMAVRGPRKISEEITKNF